MWFGEIKKIELRGRAEVRFSYSDSQNKRDKLECTQNIKYLKHFPNTVLQTLNYILDPLT